MNAFIKTFDMKTFIDRIDKLKPDYLFMGPEAYSDLIKESINIDFSSLFKEVKEGYKGNYHGSKVYVISSFPSEKIIFGVE